jgi:hypothetical protein
MCSTLFRACTNLQHEHEGLIILGGGILAKYNFVQSTPAGGAAKAARVHLLQMFQTQHIRGSAPITAR